MKKPYRDRSSVILGAGPAGLAAAHELAGHGISCSVIDRNESVGGLCRTIDFDGYLFDIGGHRFLSRSSEVNALWKSVLGSDLLSRTRKSRILYGKKFYSYPLRPLEAFTKMGPAESLACLASYVRSQFNDRTPESFETWMTRKFGRRLYRNFFKSYTEKVWGISCSELSSDWAAQRIQQLSLKKALLESVIPAKKGGAKSLSSRFYYPRLGPGQFCDRLQSLCSASGVRFHLGQSAEDIYHEDGKITAITAKKAGSGAPERFEAQSYLSSIPLPLMIHKLRPRAPEAVIEAAGALKFRNFVSVNLIYDVKEIFDDHWIYLHSPEVNAGRIQNYKNWSPFMVPDDAKTSLGVEYFISEGDPMWEAPQAEWIKVAVSEVERLGIADGGRFIKGFAVKVPNAYPVYNRGYRENVQMIRGYLESFSNLQCIGRAGLFRYNNSDHALLTGLYAARNILGEMHDVWRVDPDVSGGELGVS